MTTCCATLKLALFCFLIRLEAFNRWVITNLKLTIEAVIFIFQPGFEVFLAVQPFEQRLIKPLEITKTMQCRRIGGLMSPGISTSAQLTQTVPKKRLLRVKCFWV